MPQLARPAVPAATEVARRARRTSRTADRPSPCSATKASSSGSSRRLTDCPDASRARPIFSRKIASRSIRRSAIQRPARVPQSRRDPSSVAGARRPPRPSDNSGLRNRRLDGKYGLGCCGRSGDGAASGLMSAMPAHQPPRPAPSRRRSARSPMPQLRRDRAAYSWIAQPQMRSDSGRKHASGATISRAVVPSRRLMRW